jgi:hypothetical protein
MASGLEGRELSLVVAVEDLALWHLSILRGFGKSASDSVSIEVTKVWAKLFKVGFMLDDAAFVGFKFDGVGWDDKVLEFLVSVEEVVSKCGPVD